MNPIEREQLRLSLLRFLEENPTKMGMGAGLLLQMARSEGRSELTRAEVLAELQYLSDKGFVADVAKSISPENRCYRITGQGRDFIAAT